MLSGPPPPPHTHTNRHTQKKLTFSSELVTPPRADTIGAAREKNPAYQMCCKSNENLYDLTLS